MNVRLHFARPPTRGLRRTAQPTNLGRHSIRVRWSRNKRSLSKLARHLDHLRPPHREIYRDSTLHRMYPVSTRPPYLNLFPRYQIPQALKPLPEPRHRLRPKPDCVSGTRRPPPHPQYCPAIAQVVQCRNAVGYHRGVPSQGVRHPRPEPDLLSCLRRDGQRHVGVLRIDGRIPHPECREAHSLGFPRHVAYLLHRRPRIGPRYDPESHIRQLHILVYNGLCGCPYPARTV